jgi:protein-S-isoprenylcysteine O-methyltransferase Ste14
MFVVRWLLSILILPGTVLGVIPFGLFHLSGAVGLPFASAPLGSPRFWLALPPALAGFLLGCWTMALFFFRGEGTAAPWDPPKRLVVRGPYRHVRNPMIVGVLLMLGGMGIYLGSPLVLGWMVLFFVGNAVYFPRMEEPGLRRRFGQDYAVYCENVPRWLPRLRPWTAPRR